MKIAIVCDIGDDAVIASDKLSLYSECAVTVCDISSPVLWESEDIDKKVYIMSDPEVLAAKKLIEERRRLCEESIRDELNRISAQRVSCRQALLDKYGVDVNELSNYSAVIEKGALTDDEIADYVHRALCECGDTTIVYVSTDRLNFPDDEADGEKIAEYSWALDSGADLPHPDVFYTNGEFYIVGAPEAALAYAFGTDAHVPCRLVKASKDTSGYVKMKNSL